MNVLHRGLFLLILSAVNVRSDSDLAADLEADQIQDLPRYVVFPGLDAEIEEIEEWNVGFASPFNVFFGPKPYILGWVGENGFAPGDGVDEYPEEEEYPDGEEGELEGEEGEEEIEGEPVVPDYDYEKA